MTAVIGVLNKSAVALAADSAVTIPGPGDQKIFNSANKIFTLSKFHPVGVAVYGAASFMEIPWELLIKSYRAELGKKSFLHLSDYLSDFIRFLKSQLKHVSSSNQQEAISTLSRKVAHHLMQQLISRVEESTGNELRAPGEEREALARLFPDVLTDTIAEYGFNGKKLEDFQDYPLDRFLEYANPKLDEVYYSLHNNLGLREDLRDSFGQLVHAFLVTHLYEHTSGLAFAGYGDEDIYPGCLSVEFGEVIDNRIRYLINDDDEGRISNEVPGIILPFGQRDVIDTFISGTDSELTKIYLGVFEKFMNEYNQYIYDLVKDKNIDIANSVRSMKIDKLVIDQLKEELKRVQFEKHTNPTYQTVAILSKEDLAEMAESLIHLTYLKRRISFREESVAGPVDVALISKHDGFIWMKRKHYFKPELNFSFFRNYLNDFPDEAL